MTANMAGALEGDLPWLERGRGGQRVWDSSSVMSRTSSQAVTDREDDFAALREAALRGVKPHRRARTVVLPGAEVRQGGLPWAV